VCRTPIRVRGKAFGRRFARRLKQVEIPSFACQEIGIRSRDLPTFRESLAVETKLARYWETGVV